MTHYQEIITRLKDIDPGKAEYLEEEIDIIRHKLKFLSEDNFPKTVFLDQQHNFTSVFSTLLAEKTKIAGGRYIINFEENPDCIIIIQSNESLYNQLPELLENTTLKESTAYKTNNIYIIQDNTFNSTAEEYLRDSEILAEILQPKYFIYGHDGTAWVKFEVQ